MSTMGVGVIGAGWVAGEHIKAFQQNPNAELVAIAGLESDRERTEAAMAGTDCVFTTRYQDLLENPDIQVVSVATPPDFHREHAVAAAKAGKHLMLEKPMATNVSDAKEIRDAVAAAGVKSVVSFVLRWNPLFEIIKAQLADNTIGKVFYGEVDYFHGVGPWYGQYTWNITKRAGVSSLLSAGCHAMDALRWFMGGEVVEVTQYATRGDGPDFKPYEYNPTTVTMCRFSDGRLGKVTSCIECIQPYVFGINLVGTDGTIRNNRVFSKTKFPGQTTWADVPTILPDSGDVSHHPFVHEVDHFIDCILSDRESHACIADAFKTHEVCYAADLSGEQGGAVKLPL